MTHEFKEIVASYQKANQKGIRAVIATVVNVDGSSYRRPGVGMLILENGQMTGAVSGGCVEKEVVRQSQSVFQTRQAKMMTYNGRYRLGCEGILYILIEPFSVNNQTIDTIEGYLSSRTSFEIKSYYTKEEESDHIAMGSMVSFGESQEFRFSDRFDTNVIKQEATLSCFYREMQPCFRLIIIGSEHDAVQLSAIASATGWEVEVVNSPKNPKALSDFPGAGRVFNSSPEELVIEKVDAQTAIILMSHNFAKDLLYLQAIKDTQPIYIGLLGPSRRREKLLSAFIEYFPDVTDAFMDCIHGPAGLNLGAETPQEIAISIIAEILSVIRNQKPIPLQDKEGGIHGKIQKEKSIALPTIANNIAHIILAAGSSSRMGSPKQLLPWKNSTLIIHEIKKSLQLRQITTFVVLGANFEMIKKEIQDFPIEIIYNQDWKSGMGSSISFGIQQVLKNKKDVDAVLITLVDQPLIDDKHLCCLISKFNNNQHTIIATAMKDQIGVPAIFPKEYFEELSYLNDDYGARYIIKNYQDQIITVDGYGKTDDIDTLQQYKDISARVKDQDKAF